MKKSISIIIISLLIFSCDSQKNGTKKNTVEDWKTTNYIDSVQILLTNEYQFTETSGYGASSFLIKSKNGPLLCTAKHLLGEAMGINPEIKTDSFNYKFKSWKAFPRQSTLSKDTIMCTKLTTEKINNVDIILQECKLGLKNDIVVLNPRFSRAKVGEKFEIIGCEYSDSNCHQRKFYATMNSYENGQLLIKSESNFVASGFSGAPVIDAKGLVIGILSGGLEFEGELYLSIELLTRVKAYLE